MNRLPHRALIIKAKTIFFLLLWAPSLLLIAGEKIEQTVSVSALESIKIQNSRGEITVEGWDENKIKVIGTLDDLTERFVLSTIENVTSIQVIIAQDKQYLRSGKGSKLTIFVPKNSNVEFKGISTSLAFFNLYKGLKIETVSGKVNLKNIHENIIVSSISGSIKASNISGSINIESVSGAIDINATSNKITLKSVSSNIVANFSKCFQVNIITVSGVAKLVCELDSTGAIEMKNVTGESHYFYNKSLDSKVLMVSSADGKIINESSNDKVTLSALGFKNMSFVVKGGDANIKLLTMNGIVALKRRH